MMVGHHPIYGVALISLNAPEAVTCFWCLVQVVFAGSMGLPASPPGIYAPGLRRFYASQAKPVEQPVMCPLSQLTAPYFIASRELG